MIRMNQSPYSTHYLQIVFSAAICLCLSDHNLIHSDVARNDVSPERSVVWGAGLQSGVVLPVRYFFIQAVNTAGENFTHSPGRDSFRVEITSRSKKEHIRIHWVKPLDRNDGSFLMRYRLYESATEGLKIEVFHRNKHVAQSPYILKGPVYHEYCDCPESDPLLWQEIMSCPAEELQASRDFSAFPSINLQRMLVEVPKRFGQRGGIVHYTILNNKIYRRSLGKYTDFKMFSDEMLLSLTRKVHMPDVEFYINVGDWPMENRQVNDTPAGPVPIISWCGSTDTRDIVLPTYDITHSTLETLRGVSNDLLSIQGNTGPVWSNKTAQAFFRGRDSREERLRLVELSKEHPELLDAGITRYFFFREKEEELGTAPLTGFFDFFKYKYQVNVDGTVAAYRFPYLMLGNSLVLKQASSFYEHFYTHLKPGKHYVPVKQNLSDLIEKITWAKENDAKVEKIAREGQAIARELLQPFRLYCYYFTVFQKYAKLQASKPEIREGMEFVPQPSDFDSFCSCQRNKQEKDEL